MPNAYDRQRLTITHSPVEKVDTAFGKLPDLFSPEQILEQVKTFITELLFPAIEELTGIDLSAFLPTIEAVFDALTTLFGDLNPLSGTFNPVGAVTHFIDLMVSVGANLPMSLLGTLQQLLVNGGQPINAGNLFGDIASGLLSEIGLGSVSKTAPNLLVAGNFPNAASIETNPMWVWDPAVTSEVDGSGSARTTCDGTLRVIRSTLVSITDDQVVPVSGKFKWAGLTSTGNALCLGVREFYADNTIHDIELAHVNSPGPAGGFVTVSGNYTPTAGAKKFYVRGIVKATATAGTVWWDGASATKPNTPNWFAPLLDLFGISDLDNFIGLDVDDIWSTVISTIMNPLGLLQDLGGRTQIQGLLDSIWGAITGGVTTNNLLSDLIAAIQSFPGTLVTGTGGPANVVVTFQTMWDRLVGGLVGSVGTGAGLADIFNVSQDVSSRATLGQFSWDILGIRNNKALNTGFLPTSKSNLNFAQVTSGATATTVPITRTAALMSYHRIEESMTLGAVSWQGYGVTNVTNAYVNIYKMNTTTGVCDTLLHASADIIGSLTGGSVPVPVVYSLPTPITGLLPGDVIGVEQIVRGTGTHNVAGSTTWMQDQAVYPRRWSSVRDSSSTLSPSSITPTYGTNVPLVEIAVTAGTVAIPHTPQINTVSLVGGSSLPIPSWANTVQVITLGGGGGGRQGGTYGISGEGGENGEYATGTWTRGVDFSGSPSITITVGAGGTGGSGTGGNGGTSTASITGHSVSSLGGEGGDALNAGGSDKQGQGPGNQSYGGVTYVGGANQDTFGGNGAAPGGGGAGGNYISFQPGGTGAPGAVWIRFVQ